MEKLLKKILPTPIFNFLKRIARNTIKIVLRKDGGELAYWQYCFRQEDGEFKNDHYQKTMLAMAERDNNEFLRNKIVVDFGCGPRGSLLWAKEANLRIGVDVLVDQYAERFRSNIIAHDMIYVKSTETTIPLPSDFADIVFSLNAMDRVNDFAKMCAEIYRILTPGGEFICSFNLEMPKSMYVAQKFNQSHIKNTLGNHFKIISYRVAKWIEGDPYKLFFENDPTQEYKEGGKGFLWLRAIKK